MTEPRFPVIRGNSIYTIADGSSWNTALQSSEKLGGSLVSIESAAENIFVFEKFGIDQNTNETISSGYWIGLTDQENEGEWKWINGEEVEWMYPDFKPGVDGFEPNGNGDHAWVKSGFDHPSKSYEEYVAIHGGESLWQERGPGWDDTWESGEGTNYGVAETPFIRRGDSAYAIVEGPTWQEAEANAQKLGGHLVTINDAEENAWIVDSFADANKSLHPYNLRSVDNDIYWIGLSTTGLGQFEWQSGEALSFENWSPSSGSNNLALTVVGDGSEMIVEAYPDVGGWVETAGWWNDVAKSGSGTNPHYGIAEIALAPNNTTTGTPTLTGEFKDGETITIDESSIEDADNFEGWTPTYKYTWEIANDPGDTTMMPIWESLDTPDATDGDENLQITDDLTGKQLRGVVGYLDGYGTNEVVLSNAIEEPRFPVIRGNSLYTIVDKIGRAHV